MSKSSSDKGVAFRRTGAIVGASALATSALRSRVVGPPGHQRDAAAGSGQRTDPPVAAAVQAGNAFVSGASLPSYDAAENDRQTREARSGPISAVEQSGVTQVALPAGGEGGRQP